VPPKGGGPSLDFFRAMELEHCDDKGSSEYHVTSNYKIKTCPHDEWQITVMHNLSKAASKEAKAHNRRFIRIDLLVKVEVSVRAGLSRNEVIAVVLYTGPMVSRPARTLRFMHMCSMTFSTQQHMARAMVPDDVRASDGPSVAVHWQFMWYNAVLRRFPTELFASIGSFTTTICVLISAVQKIAREMKLPEGLKLYRGMGGHMDLPPSFFHADEKGRKGFVEWAFMSTTSNLEVTCILCLWLQGAGGAGGVGKKSRGESADGELAFNQEGFLETTFRTPRAIFGCLGRRAC
jgi:hypothetical protein